MGIFDEVKDDLKNRTLDSNFVLKTLKEAGAITSGLTIQVTGGKVVISGPAVSDSEKAKITKLVSGIEGVTEVSNISTVQNTPPKEEEQTFYVVKTGDTLGNIAKQFYGNSSKYTAIFEHNKHVWTENGKKPDANVIFPGWKFEIPKL